jgi:uncharacterized protein involved in response to NO
MSSSAALQRRHDYAGPALFSYGFRPFFLAAGLWAAFGILLWLPQYLGALTIPTLFPPLDWHIHEMLYGYAAATIAGFLLTAVPNWTGRLPVNGLSLAALSMLWLAGRVAILCSAVIGGVAAAAIDTSFLFVLAVVAAREIVSGRNWRNLRVLVPIGVLTLGNVVFHIEVLLTGRADYGVRIAIAAVLMLISLIGGRIVPSFTTNWIKRENPGRLPVPFARFDVLTMLASAIALLVWIALPEQTITGALLLIAGLLHVVRVARWAGDRTVADRLVMVLHVAYMFVPLGFILTGISNFTDAVPVSAGLHAWTAGAIGLMTIAVMTRATLGHTGRPLHASAATQAIYGCVLLAALIRVCAAFVGSMIALDVAGALWIMGFAGFAIVYAPLLARRKPAWDAVRAPKANGL